MVRIPNLTPEALVDLRRELRRSQRDFGGEQTLKLQAKLVECFRRVDEGSALGHRHLSARAAHERILCITVRPLLVFYDCESRDVLRIVDGRRDPLTMLAGNQSDHDDE